jgi:uncharacterized protein DUF6446
MIGKLLVILFLAAPFVVGGGIYYLQVYGYYDEVTPDPGRDVMLVSRATGNPEPITYDDFQAIDAASSPIRYRACFTTSLSPDDLAETRVEAPGKLPRIAPGWFTCFEGEALTDALETGTARAFMSAKNISYGVDRFVAVMADGRGFVWHDLNDCGEKTYDGTVIGEDCPIRPSPEQ